MDAPISVFLGAETGVLKVCIVSKSFTIPNLRKVMFTIDFNGSLVHLCDVKIGEKTAWANVNDFTGADRAKEITCICWTNKFQNQIAVGLRNQTVEEYNTDKNTHVKSYSFGGGEGPFKGICRCDDKYITCVESGVLQVWEDEKSQIEINCGENVHRMRQDADNPHIIATGGKENDLKIWNLNTPNEPVFKAKNVANDWLNLRVPVWVTDVAFFPGGQKVVTSTGHHQIRLYDTKCGQRRPVLNMEFDEYPITAMSLSSNENQVIVGNTHGNMALIDVRNAFKLVHIYKGFAGAIRSLHCHASRPLVASCGLDRFLHVHNVDTKEQVHKVYLKSRLNCVLFADSLADTSRNEQFSDNATSVETAANAEQKETDDLWNSMEEVGRNKKLVKHKTKGEKERKRTNEEYSDSKKKGKKRKNVQLRNVFYEERTADQATETCTSEESGTKKKRKKKKLKLTN